MNRHPIEGVPRHWKWFVHHEKFGRKKIPPLPSLPPTDHTSLFLKIDRGQRELDVVHIDIYPDKKEIIIFVEGHWE